MSDDEAYDFDNIDDEITSQLTESTSYSECPDISEIKRTVSLIHSCNTKSWVWQYCGKYPETIPNSKVLVVCNICRDKYKDKINSKPKLWEINYGSTASTSKIHDHFRKMHKDISEPKKEPEESEGSVIKLLKKGNIFT